MMRSRKVVGMSSGAMARSTGSETVLMFTRPLLVGSTLVSSGVSPSVDSPPSPPEPPDALLPVPGPGLSNRLPCVKGLPLKGSSVLGGSGLISSWLQTVR